MRRRRNAPYVMPVGRQLPLYLPGFPHADADVITRKLPLPNENHRHDRPRPGVPQMSTVSLASDRA